jgi:hypothetical protein
VTIRPWTDKQFSINANYIDQRIDNPISTFPQATAEIQAAFPNHFLRDANGNLIEVDQRPVNFDWTWRRDIRFGFNWSTPVGKAPPRPQRPAGAFPFPRRDGQGQQGAAPPPGPPPDGQGPPPPNGQGQQQAQNGQGQNGQGANGQGPGAGFRGGPGGGGPGGPGGPGGARGFGGGGGGRGGFGGPGGGGGAPGQARFDIAVFDTLYFTDQTLLRPGGPMVDLLAGSPTGKTGGQPLNAIDGQMGFTKGGYGARLNATWTQGTTVTNAGGLSPTGTLTFSDLTTINLRLFANLGQIPQVARKHPFFRNARVTLSVFNVFDQHLNVRDVHGQTPLGYEPALLDPTGRQLQLAFRKLF